MYRSARGVWFGLAKNAREGMAATAQIGFWTLVLFCGQVLPFLLLLAIGTRLPALAVGLAMAPRLFAAVRFRSSLLGALLHPIGVAVLLAIQWYAIGRSITGRPVGWKGRANPSAVQQSHPGI
jgi:hypothetical protein